MSVEAIAPANGLSVGITLAVRSRVKGTQYQHVRVVRELALDPDALGQVLSAEIKKMMESG